MKSALPLNHALRSQFHQSDVVVVVPVRIGGSGGHKGGFFSGSKRRFAKSVDVEVGKPSFPSPSVAKLSLSDQAFFLLAFVACTTSVAFTSLVIAAVPTLFAMGRAAISLSKLADTAREELPSTMAAIRLSGMEISDLTLELNDLSQEIAEGVSKSTQTVQAAGAGIRQIAMIQERASLPIISLQPAVVGAAKKTTRAVGQATRIFMNIISPKDSEKVNEEDVEIDRFFSPPSLRKMNTVQDQINLAPYS
ncbi:hypothetical protein Prudu_022916 [Prunus dulcis]|uniref:Uncharacterized protein n=1 Tax=Prunus dulcis TaxID=3755 RepID=A0A4Y1S2L7_PRUDU|nr:hypothetical protein Prudu_022916 [Prunus dulcis]